MDIEGKQAAAPWHLWVVGILAVLFTAYGAYDYYMSQIGDRAYIEAVMGPYGIDTDQAVAYFSGFPVWLDAFWAIGVWGALAGSVLILLRRRLAFVLLALSMAGLVVSNAYGFANPMPGLTDTTATLVASAVVFFVMLGITIYARAMAAKGVLR